MAMGALFVGWGALIPGREEAGGEVLQESMTYLQQLQRDGRIDGFDAVALAPHGGDLAGFVLVRGDKESIAELRGSDEFLRILVRMQQVHHSVGAVDAFTGAELGKYFSLWDEPLRS